MRLIKILLLIAFFVCSIVFFIQNMATLSKPLALRFDPLPTFTKVEASSGYSPVATLTEVPLTEEMPKPGLLAWQSDGVPLYIVVLATFLIGVLFSCVYFLLERIRHSYIILGKKRKIRALEKEVGRLNAELIKARNSPKVTLETVENKAVEGKPVKELPQNTVTAEKVKESAA